MYHGSRGWPVALFLLGLLACKAADNRSAVSASTGGMAAPPVETQPGSNIGAAGADAQAAGSGDRAEAGALSAGSPPIAAGAGGEVGPAQVAGGGGAGQPAADGGMAGAIASDSGAKAEPFVLIPVGFPMAGDELTFPESANPPTNASPELMWTGVPAGSKSLAVVFRDLGNDAIKWIIWDIPPTVTRLPPNIAKVAMPPEVPGSSQLGSLANQGYAGPGSGARQYDFKLWALDIDKLPVSRGLTTAEIHSEVLPAHDIAITEPILVRNTRNLR